MPSLSPDVEPQELSATAQTLQDDFQARLKILELQLTLEHQRQRDHVEEELHKLRQQLAIIAREQQQQTTLTTLREIVDELRKEVAEALHRLSYDVDRVAQHAEAQTSRALERLRNELLESLFERDQSIVKRHILGELLINLGKNLQEAGGGEEP
jgi:predicted DsbA family dithiol-disulfide isomerase